MSTGIRVEAWPGGVRTDVSALVRYAEGVQVERGRTTPNRTGGPSTVTCRVDNGDGRFTLTNPRGPWYGVHTVGTEYAVSVDGPGHLWAERSVGAPGYASTPDSAALSITGDLDVAVDVDAPAWHFMDLVQKYTRTGNQKSWALRVTRQTAASYPALSLVWSANGSTVTTIYATAPVPLLTGRAAVRATLDVDNGAGGWTARFYTAPTMPASDTPATNLITNGSFGSDITGWNGTTGAYATISWDGTVGRTALGALKWTQLETAFAHSLYYADGLGRPATTVTPGVTYQWTAWLYTASAGVSVETYLSWRSDPSTQISSTSGGSTVLTAGVWNRLVTTGVAPAGAAYARATLLTSGSTATIWVDDASLGVAPWTQLGDPVTGTGVTSIYDSTAPIVLGDHLDGVTSDPTSAGARRRSYRSARILSGIGGTPVAAPDFTAATDRAATYTDPQGNVWTPTGGAEIRARSYRAWGELASSEPDQDTTGTDAWADLTIGGALRRLQKDTRVQSAYTRALAGGAIPGLVEWWPLEDPSGSTVFGSALDGGAPAVQGAGNGMTAAADSGVFVCSTALPTLGTASLKLKARAWSPTGVVGFSWLSSIDPNAVIVDGTTLVQLAFTGNIRTVKIKYALASAGITLEFIDDAGSTPYVITPVGLTARAPGRWTVLFDDSGANLLTRIEHAAPDGTVTSATASQPGLTLRRLTTATLNPGRIDLGTTVVGQVLALSAGDTTTALPAVDALKAYAGETALYRFDRLCGEAGIVPVAAGAPSLSTAMGPMAPGTRWDQIAECETACHGVLTDDREALAVRLVDGLALGRQTPRAALSFTGGDLVGGRPGLDDSLVENTVTATGVQGAGGSATVVVVDGLTGTGAAGERATDYTVSVSDPGALVDHAAWIAHEGTPGEPTWSGTAVHLQRPQVAAVADGVRALDVGSSWTLAGPPAWTGAEDADQVVVGLNESIDQFEHRVSTVVRPAAWYRAGRWDDATSGTVGGTAGTRWSPGPCALASSVTSTGTSLSVTVGSWSWGHADGDYDIVVGGERCTVTAVGTPSGGVQALTVVRGAGGWAAAHAAGAAVELADPTVWLWRA